MKSDRLGVHSKYRCAAAFEGLARNLWACRKDPAESEIVQSIQKIGLSEAEKRQVAKDNLRFVKKQYKAARTVWPNIVGTFKNWQVLETKFPGASIPEYELGKFTELRKNSPFEPSLQVRDHCCIQQITAEEIDQVTRDAFSGDPHARERLQRIHQYQRMMYFTASDLMSYCLDDLHQLVSQYYTVSKDELCMWTDDVYFRSRLGKTASVIEDLLICAIAMTGAELILWVHQCSALDRRSKHFKVTRTHAQWVAKRYQKLSRIRYDFRLHRYCTDQDNRRPKKPEIIVIDQLIGPPRSRRRKTGELGYS